MGGRGRWTLAVLAAALALTLTGGREIALTAGGGASVELPEEGGLVALTFDDGPRPSTTGRLLDGSPPPSFWWVPGWRTTRRARPSSGAWRRRGIRWASTPLTT